MTNFEFYEDEIKSRGFNFAVDKSNGELFQFVQFEDEEPRAIKDILESCEVVNDAE